MNINVDTLFTTGLLLIFITLKLCHVIDWSWWWVISPIWIPLLLIAALCLLYVIVEMLKIIFKRT